MLGPSPVSNAVVAPSCLLPCLLSREIDTPTGDDFDDRQLQMATLSALQLHSQPQISAGKFRARSRALELSSARTLAAGQAQLLSRAGGRDAHRSSSRARHVTKDEMAGEYEEVFADISEVGFRRGGPSPTRFSPFFVRCLFCG